ncbi:Disease resistance protein RFL1 [Citrus sinensis]|uniref:Disease resistance protein RFL1 n=1 Tax=Citrus sinensis TaxID=2711 RepID=A0ACB8JB05_CITSI|nr:Disease resistance protein RFL1 [Citrus sinensis]
MGNVCSASFSCNDTISHCLDCIVSQAGYICHLKDNCDVLQTEFQKLIEARNDVQIRVTVAEQRQMRRLQQVHGWLSRVQDVEKEVPRLLAEIIGKEEEILGGFCSGNCIESYKYGKRVVESLKNVQSLRKEGDFKDVAQTVPENPVDERPLPPTVMGMQSTLDGVWRCLTEESVGIVGLYGMGGVGKTTLLTQINNSFLHTPNNFDFVIWEVVSRNLQLEKIQESIAKKIGLCNESWDSKSFDEKSQEIFKTMRNTEFVLLLDDIWELVDLAQVGLPVPSRTSASKVVFTTREFEVCGQMDAHKSFKVEYLVLAGVGLTETPRSELWQEVTRMSLMQNKIRTLWESPASPHLLTLFLSSNYISGANKEFFQSMASLRVLKLSHNISLLHFPVGISNLVSLQYLDLSETDIEGLPVELKYLVNLKCFNLESTYGISKIPRQVISNLKMLEALRMFRCGSDEQESDSILFGGSLALVEELLSLKHLNVLTITLQSFAALQRLLASSLQSVVSNTQSLSLTNCHSLSSLSVFTLASLRHLEALDVTSCKDLEEMEIDYAGEEVKRILKTNGFFSLQRVSIGRSKLRHVTWLILAPNLKRISMHDCHYLEEIVSLEKLGGQIQNRIPFARLECLSLYGLEKLRSIYPRALPFPHLKELKVDLCPELKKLPFDCTSGLERKLIIKGQEWWWNNLQWGDQATQNAFLPCLKTLYF